MYVLDHIWFNIIVAFSKFLHGVASHAPVCHIFNQLLYHVNGMSK